MVLIMVKKLRVQPLYTIFVKFILFTLLLLCCAMPTILSWECNLSIATVLFYGFFGISAVVSFIAALSALQCAELSEDILIIKNPFKKIKLCWEQIACVEYRNLITHDSRGVISYRWLIIKTDVCQTIETAVGKRFAQAPYLIIATPQNLATLKEYAEKHPHIIWSDKTIPTAPNPKNKSYNL